MALKVPPPRFVCFYVGVHTAGYLGVCSGICTQGSFLADLGVVGGGIWDSTWCRRSNPRARPIGAPPCKCVPSFGLVGSVPPRDPSCWRRRKRNQTPSSLERSCAGLPPRFDPRHLSGGVPGPPTGGLPPSAESGASVVSPAGRDQENKHTASRVPGCGRGRSAVGAPWLRLPAALGNPEFRTPGPGGSPRALRALMKPARPFARRHPSPGSRLASPGSLLPSRLGSASRWQLLRALRLLISSHPFPGLLCSPFPCGASGATY